jgi:hypothetical protein
MYRQFLKEPWWFQTVIAASLFSSVIFSSSFFHYDPHYQGYAKLAAAVFFCSYGWKLRRNLKISGIFFGAALLCIYLAWNSFNSALPI